MAKTSLPLALATLVLAGSLLSACGTSPAASNVSERAAGGAIAQAKVTPGKAITGRKPRGKAMLGHPVTAATKMLVPPAVKLPAKKSKLKRYTVQYANSYVENTATDALFQYNDMRNDWLATNDNNRKSDIEQAMLNELVGALQQIQNEASGDYNLEGAATNALEQYQSLDNQWAATRDDNQKEYIINEMLNELTGAIKNLQEMSA